MPHSCRREANPELTVLSPFSSRCIRPRQFWHQSNRLIPLLSSCYLEQSLPLSRKAIERYSLIALQLLQLNSWSGTTKEKHGEGHTMYCMEGKSEDGQENGGKQSSKANIWSMCLTTVQRGARGVVQISYEHISSQLPLSLLANRVQICIDF